MSGRRFSSRGESAPQKGAPPFQRRLVVMVKVPVAGRVKTRLAHQVGIARATSFSRHTAAAVLARLGASRVWETVLAVTPDTQLWDPRWPSHLMRIAQGGGDLGQRMQRIMRRQPPGPVVIIGTDIPAIRPGYIAAAFAALGRCDAVLGPARDGGYWLVGLKRTPRVMSVFGNVRWSSPHALEDTLTNLAGYRVARAVTLGDVDDAHELACAASWFGRRVLPSHVRSTPCGGAGQDGITIDQRLGQRFLRRGGGGHPVFARLSRVAAISLIANWPFNGGPGRAMRVLGSYLGQSHLVDSA
jgi:rSAM/selenodomain-associated transferase 1